MPLTTPWDAEAGSAQGRSAPTSSVPFEGAFVYQFGHDLPGQLCTLRAFDFHQIRQDDALAGVKALRVKARIRPPAVLQPGTSWIFQLSIDGGIARQFLIQVAGAAEMVFTDILANVGSSAVPPPHAVSFQLTLLGAVGTDYTVELPGVAIDDVVEDLASYDPGVGNRVPEPGAVAAPLAGGFVFDLFATGASPPDLARTTVYVDAIAVYSGGAFLAGWAAASSAAGNSGGAITFTVVPAVPWTSQELVTVRVVSAVVGGPLNALDQAWSFTTIDVTAPTVLSAVALDATHVRVTFSESVAPDALDAVKYTLALLAGAPAVTPAVHEVDPGSTSVEVVLVLEDPLTHAATYRVTATALHDLAGNALGAPNTADFLATTLPTVAGRSVSLLRRIPEINRAVDLERTQDLRKFIACLQVVFDELLVDVDRWTEILDPDLAPEAFVDAMLKDLGNPFSVVLTLEEKRALVPLLVPLYQLKGTDDGIIDAIRIFLGLEVTVVVPANEGIWILSVSQLGDDTVLGSSVLKDIYSFDIVSAVNLTEEQRKQLRAIVAYMRRAPTHLRAIVEPQSIPGAPDHWELGMSELGTESLLH